MGARVKKDRRITNPWSTAPFNDSVLVDDMYFVNNPPTGDALKRYEDHLAIPTVWDGLRFITKEEK